MVTIEIGEKKRFFFLRRKNILTICYGYLFKYCRKNITKINFDEVFGLKICSFKKDMIYNFRRGKYNDVGYIKK